PSAGCSRIPGIRCRTGEVMAREGLAFADVRSARPQGKSTNPLPGEAGKGAVTLRAGPGRGCSGQVSCW
ncbi:MAG: hypothetical protein R3324_04540, partial [Halobacteriales archaeon]|nr:hypothetical protein [Halobacteriales archaeon]